MRASLLAGCLFFSACNPFLDPEPKGGALNYNPPPEGAYYFTRVSSEGAFGEGKLCSLQVVRRPLPTKSGGSGNRARFQDETRGTCVAWNRGAVDSIYRMDTVFFQEAAGNLVMDSVDHFFGQTYDHFFGNSSSMSFPQSAFYDSGSGTWEDCTYTDGGGTIPCKRFWFSGNVEPYQMDTLVFLRDFGLLHYLHSYHLNFHGVGGHNRIRLERIIRGRDTLDFDGTLSI